MGTPLVCRVAERAQCFPRRRREKGTKAGGEASGMSSMQEERGGKEVEQAALSLSLSASLNASLNAWDPGNVSLENPKGTAPMAEWWRRDRGPRG